MIRLNRPDVRDTIIAMRELKATTLTNLGDALGQETTDNCPEQQALRRVLRGLIECGFVSKVYGDQHMYLWHENAYERWLNNA